MKPIILTAAVLLTIAIASCAQAPVDYTHRVDTLYIRDTVHVNNPIDTNALRLKGRLHSWVYVSDYLQATPDHRDIIVRVDNTRYETLTDSSGQWVIDSLPTGTYDITFSKQGFDSSHLYGVQFVGGGDIYIPQDIYRCIPRIPTMTVTGLKLADWKEVSGYYYYYFGGRLSSPAKGVNVGIFIGRDWNVSSDPSTYLYSYGVTTDTLTGELAQLNYISSAITAQYGFKTGDLMYIVAYPIVAATCRYMNREQRASVTLGLGPHHSDVIRIAVK